MVVITTIETTEHDVNSIQFRSQHDLSGASNDSRAHTEHSDCSDVSVRPPDLIFDSLSVRIAQPLRRPQ